jgi:hypothetical protein
LETEVTRTFQERARGGDSAGVGECDGVGGVGSTLIGDSARENRETGTEICAGIAAGTPARSRLSGDTMSQAEVRTRALSWGQQQLFAPNLHIPQKHEEWGMVALARPGASAAPSTNVHTRNSVERIAASFLWLTT